MIEERAAAYMDRAEKIKKFLADKAKADTHAGATGGAATASKDDKAGGDDAEAGKLRGALSGACAKGGIGEAAVASDHRRGAAVGSRCWLHWCRWLRTCLCPRLVPLPLASPVLPVPPPPLPRRRHRL